MLRLSKEKRSELSLFSSNAPAFWVMTLLDCDLVSEVITALTSASESYRTGAPILTSSRATSLMVDSHGKWSGIIIEQFPSATSYLDCIDSDAYKAVSSTFPIRRVASIASRYEVFSGQMHTTESANDSVQEINPSMEETYKLIKSADFSHPKQRFYMLNLQRFYRPDGFSHYAKYANGVTKIVMRAGGAMAAPMQPVLMLHDPSGMEWDITAAIDYPSMKSFTGLTKQPGFHEAHLHREKGLLKQGLIVIIPDTVAGKPVDSRNGESLPKLAPVQSSRL